MLCSGKVIAAADDDDNNVVVGIECYQLESVCRLRKYLSFVELGLSFLTSRVVFVSGWSELVKAQVSGQFIPYADKCGWQVKLYDLINMCHAERFRDEYCTHYKVLCKCPVCLLPAAVWHVDLCFANVPF